MTVCTPKAYCRQYEQLNQYLSICCCSFWWFFCCHRCCCFFWSCVCCLFCCCFWYCWLICGHYYFWFHFCYDCCSFHFCWWCCWLIQISNIKYCRNILDTQSQKDRIAYIPLDPAADYIHILYLNTILRVGWKTLPKLNFKLKFQTQISNSNLNFKN